MQTETDITVAAVIEHRRRFLMVREWAGGRIVLNNPGGHIEAGESPEQAVVREVREETGYGFVPSHLLGVYLWREPGSRRQALRIVYSGHCDPADHRAVNDTNIVRAEWLTLAEIDAAADQHRYPFVKRCCDDYLDGRRQPSATLEQFLPLQSHLAAVAAQADIV